MAPRNEDPLDKLARIVDERINAAFESRDSAQREKDDPWARLEGAITRAVDAALDRRLAAGDDEDEDEEPRARGRRRAAGAGKGEKDEDGPLSVLFGGA